MLYYLKKAILIALIVKFETVWIILIIIVSFLAMLLHHILEHTYIYVGSIYCLIALVLLYCSSIAISKNLPAGVWLELKGVYIVQWLELKEVCIVTWLEFKVKMAI